MSRRILLISNSISHGGGFLDHCSEEIVDFLGKIKEVLFIPYALHDRDNYAKLAQNRFKKMGLTLTSIHRSKNPGKSIEKAPALFVGGGNTFRLLTAMYKNRLLNVIRKRVNGGMPYIGASAGSNLASPTIKTTNDMPIVEPPSLKALNLVQFNINPHYLDPDPKSTHKGETREQRINEFHEENQPTVVGLREGSMLRIKGKQVSLKGTTAARIFRKGKKPVEYKPGAKLNFLLKPT